MNKAGFNTKTRFIAFFCILTLASSVLLGGCGVLQPVQPQINDTTAVQPTGTAQQSNADVPAAEGRLEGPGFASGEDALLYALSAIRNCDLEALVSCYAVETVLERFNFEDYYAYNSFYTYHDNLWPADGGFGTAMNRYTLEARVLLDAALPFIGAVNGCFADGLNPGVRGLGLKTYYTDTANGGVNLDEYFAALKGGEAERVLGTLRVTGGVFNVTEAYLAQAMEDGGQERYENLLSRFELSAKAYGADQRVSFGIPVNVDGLDCYFSVTALNYGDRWYLLSVGNSFADNIGGFGLSNPGTETADGLPAPALPDVSSAGTLAARRYEGPGFSSPEEAAKAYLEAVVALDPDAAVACYAVDRLADGDLLAFRRTSNFSENLMGGGTFLASAARITLAASCATQLGRNYLCILDMVTYDEQEKHWYETIDGGEITSINTNKVKYPYARAQLHDLLNNHVIRVKLKLSQENLESIKLETTRDDGTMERAAKLGASDFAIVTLPGNDLTLDVYVYTACFDGRWYVFPTFLKDGVGKNSEHWTLYS